MALFGAEVKDPLKAVGGIRRNDATNDTSKYYRDTLQSYIPAELAERLGVDRTERMRTKILMAAGLAVDQATGKGTPKAGDGPQTLLNNKIEFHRQIEAKILKFSEEYAILFYEYGLINRKDAVKRAAFIGNFLLDEVTSTLEGDDTDKVLQKAPNISNNISGLAMMEAKPSMKKESSE